MTQGDLVVSTTMEVLREVSCVIVGLEGVNLLRLKDKTILYSQSLNTDI